MRLDTFRAFSECAERMKNAQKEIFPFNNACELKGTAFRKNRMGDDMLA
jgi:hypothetical protein